MLIALLVVLGVAVITTGAVWCWYEFADADALHDTSRHHGWEDTTR